MKLLSLVAMLGFASCAFAQETAIPDIPFDSVPNLLKLPADLYLGEASGVAVNSKKHIFVYSRGNSTGPAYAATASQILEFGPDGKYVREIGHGLLAERALKAVLPPKDEFPYTLQLAIGGFVVGLLLGGTLGIVAGVLPNGWIDTICMTLALAGLSLPSFWIGMILIQVFATQLGWVPVLGTGFDALILPSISLGLFIAGGLARLVRNSIIEVMTQDYIRTAHAKGLTALRVVAKHALRNAVIPPLTLLGIQFALLIGGAVVTETVFARPGIGRLLVLAVLEKDFPVVQGVVVLTTAAYVLINLLIDISYGIIDPRVRA